MSLYKDITSGKPGQEQVMEKRQEGRAQWEGCITWWSS